MLQLDFRRRSEELAEGLSERLGMGHWGGVRRAGDLVHSRIGDVVDVTAEAHQNYLRMNPYNESRFFYPIEQGDWIDEEDVAAQATEITLQWVVSPDLAPLGTAVLISSGPTSRRSGGSTSWSLVVRPSGAG